MDGRKLETKIIKEAISKGSYELTGILNTGEIVIAIVNPSCEKKIIEKYFDDEKISNEEKLKITKKFIRRRGRPAKEFMQVYEQKCNLIYPRCKKNNLIFR